MAISGWNYEHNILSWGSLMESHTLTQKSSLFSSDMNEVSEAFTKNGHESLKRNNDYKKLE